MIDNKIISGLKSLSPSELKSFQLFIEAGFVNQSIKSRKLLSLLATFHPSFQSKKLSELALFTELFPNKPFHKQRLREEFAQLFSLLKKFLAYQEFQSRPYQEDIWVLTQFRKRRMEKAFKTQWKTIDKTLAQDQIRDAEYFRLQSELAHEANGFFGNKQIRVVDNSLQAWVDNFDRFYIIRKLRESCEILNRKHVLNADYQLNMMEEIDQYLSGSGKTLLEIPAIRIYHQIFLMFSQTENESHYSVLVELLGKFHHHFTKEEGRGMYKYVQNYCIRQINQGNSEYLQKLFQLYQSELENGIIFSGDYLAHTDYKNITTVGLRLGEFDWVYHFLHQYQDKVTEHFRMNVFNYCLASWYLEKGSQDQAIRLLQKVNFTDLQYQISARYLLFKAYYETEEWESLTYLIKAFLNFIRRNKGISPGNRSNHRNFLQILQLMVRLRMRKSFLNKDDFQRRFSKIEERLKENAGIPHLGWLKEKLNDL